MPFYTKYVGGTTLIPFESYFKFVGLKFLQASESIAYMGFLALPDSNNVFKVSAVIPDSPAEKMGLKNGDDVLSIDGIERDKPEFVDKLMSQKNQTVGGATMIVVKRKKETLNLSGKVGARVGITERLTIDSAATSEQARLRARLFSFPGN
jgi:predicted metalloprotease with PDZ domain